MKTITTGTQTGTFSPTAHWSTKGPHHIFIRAPRTLSRPPWAEQGLQDWRLSWNSSGCWGAQAITYPTERCCQWLWASLTTTQSNQEVRDTRAAYTETSDTSWGLSQTCPINSAAPREPWWMAERVLASAAWVRGTAGTLHLLGHRKVGWQERAGLYTPTCSWESFQAHLRSSLNKSSCGDPQSQRLFLGNQRCLGALPLTPEPTGPGWWNRMQHHLLLPNIYQRCQQKIKICKCSHSPRTRSAAVLQPQSPWLGFSRYLPFQLLWQFLWRCSPKSC